MLTWFTTKPPIDTWLRFPNFSTTSQSRRLTPFPEKVPSNLASLIAIVLMKPRTICRYIQRRSVPDFRSSDSMMYKNTLQSCLPFSTRLPTHSPTAIPLFITPSGFEQSICLHLVALTSVVFIFTLDGTLRNAVSSPFPPKTPKPLRHPRSPRGEYLAPFLLMPWVENSRNASNLHVNLKVTTRKLGCAAIGLHKIYQKDAPPRDSFPQFGAHFKRTSRRGPPTTTVRMNRFRCSLAVGKAGIIHLGAVVCSFLNA